MRLCVKKGIRSIPVLLVALVACASFINDESAALLRGYESCEYTLKQDSAEGYPVVKKGQAVRLYIVNRGDSVKVYCYPAGTDILKSERALILYLFEDDFPDKKFSREFFEQKLYNVVDKAVVQATKKK